MKTLNIKKYVLLAAMSAVLSGCVTDEDMVQADPNFDSELSFWKTDEDAVKGLSAAYSALLADGTYMRSTPLLLDLKGDDTRSNSPWVSMANVGRFNTSVSDPAIYAWGYEMYYQGIYRCNQVLTRVPQMTMQDDELKNRILGQAHFLRGLYLFHAVNMFKNVPIPLSLEDLKHPQKTEAEGWAQVKSDFQMAADLLPVSYAAVSNPLDAAANGQGRATRGAALAYLGKAQLFTHDFAAAKTTFESVIGLGVYSLVSNYRDNFTSTNENNSESLFEVQFSREAGGVVLGWGGIPQTDWGKASARAITYGPRQFGFTDVQPTVTLFNEFKQELTVSGQVDPRLDATIFYNKPGATLYGQSFAAVYANNAADLNDLYCRKYQNSDGDFANEMDWRSGINERLLRYADVLLMYAETLNETGATSAAYQYIQMVRSRVGLADLATVRPGMTQEQMRDQIAHERFLELALEGHRSDDIRRWGWYQNPAKLAWLKQRDPEFNTYTEGREYFPIPQLEMDTNQGTIQNLGY